MSNADEFSAVELNEYDNEADFTDYDSAGVVTGGISEERFRRMQLATILLSVALFGVVLLVFASVTMGYVAVQNDEEALPSPSPSPPSPTPPTPSTPTPTPAPSSSSSLTLPAGGLSETELDALASEVKRAMDTTIDPCEDYYMYACGSWLEDNINFPADRSSWTKSFTLMALKNEEILNGILEQRWPLLGSFYDSCMDMATRDALGITPIESLLEKAGVMNTISDIGGFVGELHKRGVGVFFNAEVDADLGDPTMNIFYVDQGGMGLPSRDYYFSTSEGDQRVQEAYVNYIASLLLQAERVKDAFAARTAADEVYALEKLLAEKALSPTQRRDPYALYHITPRSEFLASAGYPGFDWDAYFVAIGIDKSRMATLNVVVPEFFSNMATVLSNVTATTLKNYLAAHILSSSASRLTTSFVKIKYEYYTALYGSAQPPLERMCLSWTNSVLGELIGRYFVLDVFDERSKGIALDMINAIEDAFVENLPSLNWMDDETRRAAQEKMSKITNKIGYPDKWRDYGELLIRPDEFLTNVDRYYAILTQENSAELGKPVDKQKWYMTPQQVNAYYNPVGNEIVFPAAILQPTFFDARWPVAMNFGGIGMVMGHELSHGFDDQGRQFDGDGRLVQWWENAAVEGFEEQAQCVVDLYSSYTVVVNAEELNVNGELTLGENIADMGGVKVAFRAMQKLLREAKQRQQEAEFQWPIYSEELLQAKFGAGSEKLFFLGMAQNWCSVYRDDYLEQRVKNDPHSPARYRVNGPFSQFPDFARVYECAEGSAMRPKNTCTVW